MPSYFTGKNGSVIFDGVQVASMDSWTLSVEGERLDVSDYDQPSFKSIVGLPVASVQMSGPWIASNNPIVQGYFLQPGDQVDVSLIFDSLGFYSFILRSRVESCELSSDVRGVIQCTISVVVIGNWIDGNGDDNTTGITI